MDNANKPQIEDVVFYNNVNAIKALIEASKAWVWSIDLNGNHTYCNPAVENVLGYKPEEMIGKNYSEFISDDERKSIHEKLESFIREKKGWCNFIIKWKHKDGSFRFLESTAVPLFDSPGNICGFSGVDRDVTDRIKEEEEKKKIEEQVRQSQKLQAIGTLAGGIAHDFNNILSSIIGNIELALYYELEKGHRARYSLEQSLSAAKKAKDLVKQIHTFSRQKEGEPSVISLSPILKEITKLIRTIFPATINIKLDIKTESDKIYGDPVKFHQILLNLCVNANQSMCVDGGSLNLVLDEENTEDIKSPALHNLKPGRYIKIIVSDTGEGISPEDLSRIFEPYFSTKSGGYGVGLGLSVVLGNVKHLDGDIIVKSEKGKGSDFTVYIPAYPEEKTFTEEELPNLPGGTESILFVDDSVEIVAMTQRLLSAIGYKVKGLSDSMEALEVFSGNPQSFDLVITDMTMPKLTGEKLSEKILSIRPDIPIIILTGYSELLSKDKMQKIGIKKVIMKPADYFEIASSIRAILDAEK